MHADILKERERLHSEQEMRCELMRSSNRVFICESVVLQMWFFMLLSGDVFFEFHSIRMSNH